MLRKILSTRIVIYVILVLQLVPLLMFPRPRTHLNSQEWWLPVLLSFLVVIALVQLLIRRSQASWPWYLLSFAQGFNIISRLMMLLPHATVNAGRRPALQHRLCGHRGSVNGRFCF